MEVIHDCIYGCDCLTVWKKCGRIVDRDHSKVSR